MKKVILLFATLSMVVLGLTGCPTSGNNNNNGGNNAQAENANKN